MQQNMTASGKTQAYDRITILLHWTLAFAIVMVAGLELFRHEFAKGSVIREALKPFHQSAGLIVLLLVLVRLAWRLFFSAAPPPHSPGLLRLGSALVHACIYVLMLALPVVGLLSLFAADKSVVLGPVQIALPLKALIGEYAKSLRAVHEVMAFSLLGLAGLHALAALAHHFILKDTVLASMLPPALVDEAPAAGASPRSTA